MIMNIFSCACLLSAEHEVFNKPLHLTETGAMSKKLYLENFIREASAAILCKFSSVQLNWTVWLFAIPWTAACPASLSIMSSWRLLKLMPTESMMPSNHLILCHPLLLLPSIFPSIRVLSNESNLHIRCPMYWSFQLQHQSFQWTSRTYFL